jgi:hypothetical protein
VTYRNPAIACRVTESSGRNLPSAVPFAMPSAFIHSISFQYAAPTGTSLKEAVAGGVNSGDPAAAYSSAAITSRVTGSSGWKVRSPPSTDPLVMPLSAIQRISK